METGRHYALQPGWQLLLRDARIDGASVLRRAALPADLFTSGRATIDAESYFKLFQALDDEAGDPQLAIRLGSAISVEAFDPPLFSAFCSPNLNVALERIARFKPLIGPMQLGVEVGKSKTVLTLEWPTPASAVPPVLVHAELAFFVQLGRIATRSKICPLEVTSPHPASPEKAFRDFFGVALKRGRGARLVFSAEDAARPFLSANERMWEVFEPDLRKRLEGLTKTATTSDKVRAALLEMLPGGAPPMAAVATRLGLSTRTMQRRLQEERAHYQGILDEARLQLAEHYLQNTELPPAEISYLLGFEDPNCFFRAYRGWTGKTPSAARGLSRRA